MKTTNTRYIYHYSAMYQESRLSGMAYIDGICSLTFKVVDMDDYHKLKELIDSENKERLTINSLSLLSIETD